MKVLRFIVFVLCLMNCGTSFGAQDLGAAKGAIAIIYPDIGEPYRSVFAKMIEGIEDRLKVRVPSYPVGSNADLADLNVQLKRSGIRVVIALGRQGLKATSSLDRDISVVVGGVLSIPDADNRSIMGVSLTPDPMLLFSRLKNLMPGIKRVFVIYDPKNNEWLIKLAKEAARSNGLELVAEDAHDLASAARLYTNVFSSADNRKDALWLPQDQTTVDESTILPLVLKESWDRGLPVFSSSFPHVKKGVLFALYPNNVELGYTLASLALKAYGGESHKLGIAPLKEVQIAVNLRTASHIGLTISVQQQRSFDSVFPEP